jgi:hypothetical protein
MAASDIEVLARVEQAAGRTDRIRFGFLRWYLIEGEAE